MSYIPNTDADRAAMLETIGVRSIDELFADIPSGARARELDLPAPLSEMEAVRHMRELAGQNVDLGRFACFLGGGAYDHFIPPWSTHVIGRERVLHRLHALPGRGQPGHAAGDLRVPDDHLPS